MKGCIKKWVLIRQFLVFYYDFYLLVFIKKYIAGSIVYFVLLCLNYLINFLHICL